VYVAVRLKAYASFAIAMM